MTIVVTSRTASQTKVPGALRRKAQTRSARALGRAAASSAMGPSWRCREDIARRPGRGLRKTGGMHTHLYSLPSAVETSEEELDGPVPPIEAVLFDFANTLFRMVPTDVFLRRVWAAAGRDVAALDVEAVLRGLRAAAELPRVRAAQEGRDTS